MPPHFGHSRSRASRTCALVAVALTAWMLASCLAGSASPAEVQKSLRARLAGLEKGGRHVVHGQRLLEPRALAAFYAARDHRPVWDAGARREVLAAIQAIEEDGLAPADYHLDTLRALMETSGREGDEAADLDLLLTDAVAGMIDHVRWGKVRPASLDARWNVDPRDDAPRLDSILTVVASEGSVKDAIAAQKPQHFIYAGLVGAYRRLREIDAAGGWPKVPAGKAIRPNASDRRVPRVRARLAATGDWEGKAPAESLRYDAGLVAAVKRFQELHRIEPDGVIDAATLEAMNVSARARANQVRVNLERSRWVLPGLEQDFLLVNLPAFKVYLIRGGKNVWESRTQIGQEARQTPAFRASMRTIVLNPDWTVPPTILEEDVIAGMREGKNMIAVKHLTILDAEGREVSPSSIDWYTADANSFPYTLRQPPGEDNALGRVKFLFPNKHSIYLHDTPSRTLFESEQRTFSSGCIRVENALDLAERLLEGQDGWNRARIEQTVAEGETKNVQLDHPLPVVIVYWTVSVGASGSVRFMKDVYDRDAAVLAALESPPRRA